MDCLFMLQDTLSVEQWSTLGSEMQLHTFIESRLDCAEHCGPARTAKVPWMLCTPFYAGLEPDIFRKNWQIQGCL